MVAPIEQSAEAILNGLEQETQAQETKAASSWEQANPNSKPERVPQIYIGNISYSSNEDSLREYFGKFGEISGMTLSKTKRKPDGTQGHRGFAFIQFADKSTFNTVIGQEHNVGGRNLSVNEAKPKTTKFFVGGLNKESTTEQSLRDHFSAFGEITDCFCVITRGFGFVTLIEDGDNLDRILAQGKHEIDGSMCDVKPAKKKEEMGGPGGRGRGRGRGRGGRGRGGRNGYGQQYSPYGGMMMQNYGQPQGQNYGQPQGQNYGQAQSWSSFQPQQPAAYGQQYGQQQTPSYGQNQGYGQTPSYGQQQPSYAQNSRFGKSYN